MLFNTAGYLTPPCAMRYCPPGITAFFYAISGRIFAMPYLRCARSVALAVAILFLAVNTLSCRDTGYRNEVTSNGEGSIQIQRVPEEKPPQGASQSPPQVPVDPGLAVIYNQWPHLSPADRQTVVELVQRLAAK
jgi:hypothetical protein